MGFGDQSLLEKLLREGRLPGPQFAAKMARVVAEAATAPLYLRACDSVGALVRTRGRPIIENSGRIDIGARVLFLSSPVPVALRTGKHGRIEMRQGSIANYGAVIVAEDRVSVGEYAGVGPYSVVSDTDGSGEPPRAIEIGAGAWIGAHVTVLPGARIGKDAVIGAGSVVEGDIPDGAIAVGIPARPKRQRRPRPQAEYPAPTGAELRGILFGGSTLSELRQALFDSLGVALLGRSRGVRKRVDAPPPPGEPSERARPGDEEKQSEQADRKVSA